jgi:uncharacterized membrane protein
MVAVVAAILGPVMDPKTAHAALLLLIAQIGFVVALAIASEQNALFGRVATGAIVILWIIFLSLNYQAIQNQFRKLTP